MLVLLYYYYTDIHDLDKIIEEHKNFCNNYDFKGRIIIANEGINGTISGSNEDCNKYIKFLKSYNIFSDIKFKIDSCNNHLFPKLSIKKRNEIVSLYRTDLKPHKKTGIHLSPNEFYNMMNNDLEDTIILDVRSKYEHNLGKFKKAKILNLDNFRDLSSEIENISNDKNKKILTYCTGGIKCEKATALLLEEGFKNVYQLDGGIINYSKEMNGIDFDGKCYVFDSRLAVDVNKINPRKITKCYICQNDSDRITNCIYTRCNLQTIICPECNIKLKGCCSVECENQPDNLKYIPFNQKQKY